MGLLSIRLSANVLRQSSDDMRQLELHHLAFLRDEKCWKLVDVPHSSLSSPFWSFCLMAAQHPQLSCNAELECGFLRNLQKANGKLPSAAGVDCCAQTRGLETPESDCDCAPKVRISQWHFDAWASWIWMLVVYENASRNMLRTIGFH